MALLTCRDLSLGYGKQNILAEHLNFSVEEGDYLCIVGENGAGKSTLLRTILGLQKPLRGEILMGNGIRPDAIGYLPQQTEVQKEFPASVEELVLSGCLGHCGLRPFYNKQEKRRAEENMERLDILPLRARCYRELSGGQQQRVLLARALCAADKLLLLDEPVSGLDPQVSSALYRLLRELNEKDHMTIIMISHDMTVALRQASHILHMGRPWFWGTAEEYRRSGLFRLLSMERGGRYGTDAG